MAKIKIEFTGGVTLSDSEQEAAIARAMAVFSQFNIAPESAYQLSIDGDPEAAISWVWQQADIAATGQFADDGISIALES